MDIKLHEAATLEAFEPRGVGTRVWVPQSRFFTLLRDAVQEHDFARDPHPGQGYIRLPDEACELVTAGVGRRSANPADYVLRCYRGRVDAYLKREFAAKAEHVAVIVYTREAYLADPDVRKDKVEWCLVRDMGYTHVIVAVLAHVGPKSYVTPYRFVANIADGNNAYYLKNAHEIFEEARDVITYDTDWCVVSD